MYFFSTIYIISPGGFHKYSLNEKFYEFLIFVYEKSIFVCFFNSLKQEKVRKIPSTELQKSTVSKYIF